MAMTQPTAQSCVDESLLLGLQKTLSFMKENHTHGFLTWFPMCVVDNRHRFDTFIDSLEDRISKELVQWFISFRLIEALTGSTEQAMTMLDSHITSSNYNELGARAKEHFSAVFEENLDVDIVETWLLNGYSLNGICEPVEGDYVLDCGAFNGNSAFMFSQLVGPNGQVFAFEPNPSMCQVLGRNKDKINCFATDNLQILNLGLSQSDGTLRFSQSGAASHIDENGSISVPVRSIDSLYKQGLFDRVDLIKFDIEGHERQALLGAISTIRDFRPKLMISIYHLHDDFIELQGIIREITPWYRYYVRHHARHGGELVLYCVPVKHNSLE